jgi:hypothetical protein
MKKLFITFFAMGLLLALCGMAQAYSWNVETDFAFFDGTTNLYTLPDGTTIASTGGNLQYALGNSPVNVPGLGVVGTPAGEISVGQTIKFTFAQSQVVGSLSLSLLYAKGDALDTADERAQITVNYSNGTTGVYTLFANGSYTGIWSGSGSVACDDPTQGLWTLTDPFGTLGVDSISLTALNNYGGYSDYRNSDFGFYALETTPTPIPGAVWLLGSGLVGLVGLRRKFRS